jgi:hypothetical protein
MNSFTIIIIVCVAILILAIIAIFVIMGMSGKQMRFSRHQLGQNCSKTSDCNSGLLCEHVCVIPPSGSCADHPHGCGHNMMCSSHHICIPKTPATVGTDSSDIPMTIATTSTTSTVNTNTVNPTDVTVQLLTSPPSQYIIPNSIISNLSDATVVGTILFYCDGSSKIYAINISDFDLITSPTIYDLTVPLNDLTTSTDLTKGYSITSLTSFFGYVYFTVNGKLFRFVLSSVVHPHMSLQIDSGNVEEDVISTSGTGLNLDLEIINDVGKGITNVTYIVATPNQVDPSKAKMYIMYQPDPVAVTVKVASIDGTGSINYLPALNKNFSYRVYSWNNNVYGNIFTVDTSHSTITVHQSGKKKIHIPITGNELTLYPSIDTASESVQFNPYQSKPITYGSTQGFILFTSH